MLLKAKREGLIREVKPLLVEMKEKGFYISDTVEKLVLNQAYE